ncbi:hypothetical protein CWE12_10865 [Aliidiomarina sedimenti]|uniref:VIT family protein n=1 Tax=Aliidiomarina sedimenti TaxID=1933879 RepID=A0ABY0BWS2_9GAMM|nr:VIT1/CCC1 transporter family protein [Aliidiomarina sedimenti]RUO28806.1 hypothetical protein CWE12_10865 [Aliidiomarina sedimenti]
MGLQQRHRIHRASWLRAAVLGANDGILSTASLVIGVAAAAAGKEAVLLAGVAGAVAGALSMGAGEYVSVSSQADLERADIELERDHQNADPAFELEELTQIYINRGLSRSLARDVASQLMNQDALAAHARDELGINPNFKARPLKAATSSAAAFSIGAALPLVASWLLPPSQLVAGVASSSLLFLALLGAFAARTGGASVIKGAMRVALWGAGAMLVTALVGAWFGLSV